MPFIPGHPEFTSDVIVDWAMDVVIVLLVLLVDVVVGTDSAATDSAAGVEVAMADDMEFPLLIDALSASFPRRSIRAAFSICRFTSSNL